MPDRMRKVLHAFAALADLGEEIAETSDFEEMVRSALHVVLGALGIRRGAVAEYERESDSLRFLASRGYGDSFSPGSSFTLKLEPATTANGNGASHALSLDELSRIEREVKARFESEAVEVVAPLVVRGELVGAILLGGKASGEAFTPEDCELVRALGRHVAVGLHHQRLLR